ncbi:Asp-tRNA(Asn)/Glu-tRNA(Gln) amidotransferase subunit GatA [Haloferax mediterranei ATCC 33500]|uniref:Glutamyl-tRNA(Gln) amidotransferase subunit A n=1 Tax=Haloferax mediterranei (strain ATCC 33500 / DSM 1411 / JCM 8866 / NBRC 14739 / NCIMB 2177 / R-4) TaxID=523841 RepID=I3R3F9_HALMT|nr:Asp-tRNA(Asn)/Glu-tRNA(Gln) amidotransferase subunit GatA [Haloferax mediterranei]AFK18769.1 aspartyl/glutamyl-tRNA amidotransferase subunit A [Haloferax mediterranei ATCC 33500]AHZ21862.1 glutamyl-tRNA amidotransferase [Haloferax mediterranei ATCC 33500]EMA03371.1 aspartyl/glutamyl-tRNA amidotransferase subunit A [Haloferax mediterranei ATCC 33500]MDX5988865.1 Asp-tRNA(Asn)/Glu-tRNA(Gln) amidotransferase subunit GatA [Haloferax mediterranei ATCC 33500]QCQ75263.1 Asp-tRNA(Asn)/Glu-tRNA(Gln)
MSLNAFITKETVESDEDGPLDGKTIAVKDNISTKGLRTTCGSAMLEDYVPPYDATVVEHLKEAGATIVGKANMDEFGMGTTTETSAFGPTKNPVDEARVPGGSSGGSAAAVAAGEADLALGTDTGGSIRCPAAFCGVVGIKPTYGLVSRYGLVAYANSLEQIGPIAPTVEDAAALLDVIAGPDDRDGTTHDDGADSDYASAADGDVEGLTIGVPTELVEGADEGVEEAFWAALDELEAQGAEYYEVSMPSVEKAVAAYYVIAMSEASSNLARFDGVRYGKSGGYEGNWNEAFARAREEGFGSEVKRRVLLGTYALSAGYHDKYYAKAQDARAWVKQDFDAAFEDVDVLASPTMPVPPFKLGESLDDPLQMYLADANTVPVNLANLPAISVPAGETEGLPVGLQLIGPKFGEETIVRAASAVEN